MKKEIYKELESLGAEHLSEQTYREEGYTLPEGYFEALTDKVIEAVERKPFSEKEEGYNVPEKYFETLSDSVMSKISGTEAQKRKPVILRMYNPLTMGIAACMVAVLAFVFLLRTGSEVSVDITEEEAMAYVMNNIDDIDMDMILESGVLEGDLSENELLPEDETIDVFLDDKLTEEDILLLEEMM